MIKARWDKKNTVATLSLREEYSTEEIHVMRKRKLERINLPQYALFQTEKNIRVQS